MDQDLRRATALIRDEFSLRAALARHEANRFDLDAVQAVRHRVDSTMETLGFIGRDDRLWDRLTEQAGALGTDETEALAWFDEAAFGAMLVACGYRTPPPPPVDELLADTGRSLALALQPGQGVHLVREARSSLIMFLYRVRRQLHPLDGEPVPPGTVIVVGRKVGEVARELLPVVVGAAVGAGVEAVLPMTGIGVAAGVGVGQAIDKGLAKGISKAAEKGTEIAARKAIAFAADNQGPLDPEPELDDLVTPDRAIAAHVAAAGAGLASFVEGRYTRSGYQARDIVRHLVRVLELSRDHDGPDDLKEAAELAVDILIEVEERILEPAYRRAGFARKVGTEDLLKVAIEAVELCLAARGEPSQFREPSYTSSLFDSEFRYDDSERRPRYHQLAELRAAVAGERSSTAAAREEGSRSSGSVIGALPDQRERGESEQQRYNWY